ncbi:hypothetical protein TR2A62_1434 [Thalassobium sp. R2A62]|nr:hypothetical protein TR2A62_1434 [Thalassobium sp. R2A62]
MGLGYGGMFAKKSAANQMFRSQPLSSRYERNVRGRSAPSRRYPCRAEATKPTQFMWDYTAGSSRTGRCPFPTNSKIRKREQPHQRVSALGRSTGVAGARGVLL